VVIRPVRTLEIFLVWWMVVAVGIAVIFGAMFHFFNGPTTAQEIGFTNGDDGFQTEVGFADLAIGVLGVLCARFRDGFMLAAAIAVSIAYLDDAYGHLHQAAIHDNHAPATPASPSEPTSSPRSSRSASTPSGSEPGAWRRAPDRIRRRSPSAHRTPRNRRLE
jgi:hypothetical protein